MKFFENFSIKSKLIISYVIMVGVSMILSWSALASMNKSHEVASFVHTTLNERYSRTRRVADVALAIEAEVDKISLGNDSQKIVPILKNLAVDMQKAADALQTARYPKEIGEVKQATAMYLTSLNKKFIPSCEALDESQAMSTHDVEMIKSYVTIQNNIFKVNGYQIKAANESVSSINDNSAIITVSIVTAVEFLVALFIVLSMPKLIINSISKIITISNTLAEGKLNREIKVSRKDEFRPLLESLEKMRLSWVDSISRIVNVSSNVRSNMADITESTTVMTNTAHENQNHALTVAAASDEMVSTTGDIAKNCENASLTSESSSQSTTIGINRVQETIDMLNRQVDRSKQDAVLVQALAETAQKIGAIVNTIDDIASQTNLLALNAAIEAARAGEAGKGFAVVADEVRALASRTSKSTQEITKMVSQVQNDSKAANDAMQASVHVLDEISSGTGKLNDILGDVTEKVSAVNAQITQIATAAEQQTTATSEISSNMKGITDGSHQLSDQIDMVQSNIDKTHGEIEELINIINQFEIK